MQFVSLLSIACNLHAFCFIIFITFLMTNTIVTSPQNTLPFHCWSPGLATAWSKFVTRLELVIASLLRPPCPHNLQVFLSKNNEQQQMRKENYFFFATITSNSYHLNNSRTVMSAYNYLSPRKMVLNILRNSKMARKKYFQGI